MVINGEPKDIREKPISPMKFPKKCWWTGLESFAYNIFESHKARWDNPTRARLLIVLPIYVNKCYKLQYMKQEKHKLYEKQQYKKNSLQDKNWKRVIKYTTKSTKNIGEF